VSFPAPVAAGGSGSWDSPSATQAPGCGRGVLGPLVAAPTHLPAFVAPSAPAAGRSCRDLLGKAGGSQPSLAPARPLVYQPPWLRSELGRFGFSKGDFRGKREHTPRNTCCCLPPLKFRRGASPPPRCGSCSSPSPARSGGGCGLHPPQLLPRVSLQRSGGWDPFAQILTCA